MKIIKAGLLIACTISIATLTYYLMYVMHRGLYTSDLKRINVSKVVNNIALVRSESDHLKNGQTNNENGNAISDKIEKEKKYYENMINEKLFNESDNVLTESEEYISDKNPELNALTSRLNAYNSWRLRHGIRKTIDVKLDIINQKIAKQLTSNE